MLHHHREVVIDLGDRQLNGDLHLAPDAHGLVLFAHGSGSSRLSPRNQFVANVLNEGGFATLLFDLLTDEEAEDRGNVFDIPLLGERLGAAAAWLRALPDAANLPLGLFGASTGSAAALVAAAQHPPWFHAVVSRGGRPDLAWDDLPLVQAPTLLIVGSLDDEVLRLNRHAAARMQCPPELRIVSGATHLFPEPGALEAVADLAKDWFAAHLTPHAGVASR